MMKIDGYNDCVVGVAVRCGCATVLAYDSEKLLAKLQTRDGMTREEAEEYYEFNIAGSYVGEETPVLISFGSYNELMEQWSEE